MSASSPRKLRIGDVTWVYRIGRDMAVIESPERKKKTLVKLSAITGRTPDTIERGRWKKSSDGMVLPSQIRRYIEAHQRDLV